jgi:hypothetical protein
LLDASDRKEIYASEYYKIPCFALSYAENYGYALGSNEQPCFSEQEIDMFLEDRKK